MKSNVISAQEVRDVEISTLPIGEYECLWGGYVAHVVIDGTRYRLRTQGGVRTLAAPSILRIQNGEATIETIGHK